ncbi:hypothetical protein BpHYR1_028502 [Brachionus plicatilis]|uniref:Uncharacterized protein n=1 Tax=Brachionus plicatilis TaxID=10195 RepID=A0A3M7QHC2_BRAPC|nr:hypothetical protein BpHYR1_028502 [Brachionus plicatilis]
MNLNTVKAKLSQYTQQALEMPVDTEETQFMARRHENPITCADCVISLKSSPSPDFFFQIKSRSPGFKILKTEEDLWRHLY